MNIRYFGDQSSNTYSQSRVLRPSRSESVGFLYTMEHYAAQRKELLLFATAQMELESIMLSEISQAVKDKYHMISPIRGI